MRAHKQLEAALADWCGVSPDDERVVVCNSGTAALHLALEALRLPSWAEVVLCDFNMIACARAVSLAGLAPVFVDCGSDLLLDPSRLDAAAGDDTQAVLVTHLYGRRADMDSIAVLAAKYGLAVVEDLAEAHGVPPHPASDAACWSFYRNKHVRAEEGGAVYFRDPSRAALARRLRCLGFSEAGDYDHLPRGCSYRLADALAAQALRSLLDFERNRAARRQIEAWYEEFCPEVWRQPPRDAVWVYDVRIDGLGRTRMGAAVRALQAAGIAARHGFLPMSAQREYASARRYGGGRARLASEEVFYLPAEPGVTTRESCRLAFDVIRASLG